MSSSDEEQLDLRAAAGFDTPPVDVEGSTDIESYFDVAELKRQLQTVSARLPPPAYAEQEPPAYAEQEMYPEVALDSPFCAADLRREYHGQSTCETLVISFGGLVQGMGGVAPHEFVGVCAKLGACTLFVRDPQQAWYLRANTPPAAVTAATEAESDLPLPTSELEDDAFASVLDLVLLEIRALRPTRLVCIGASMGGYAALRAGLSLGAAAVIAFGPQIFIDPAEREALGLPAMFFDSTLRMLAAR